MITLLLPPEVFPQEVVEVTGESYQHLFRARRTAVGERVRVVDGEGQARWGVVETVDRRRGWLRLGDVAPTHEPPYPVHLLVASPRPQRASWMVEKVTELGVTHLHFLHGERAPRGSNLERLGRVAAAAVEQCHRASLPILTGPHPLSQIPEIIAPCPQRWMLSPAGKGGSFPAGEGAVALAVGPEGGWSEDESHQLLEWGFQARVLGPRILRIETAAVVGIALATAGWSSDSGEGP